MMKQSWHHNAKPTTCIPESNFRTQEHQGSVSMVMSSHLPYHFFHLHSRLWMPQCPDFAAVPNGSSWAALGLIKKRFPEDPKNLKTTVLNDPWHFSLISAFSSHLGKAATGAFWWLGTGWYQLATLISLLNVFLLTRSVSISYGTGSHALDLKKRFVADCARCF